ncbi:formylmethanofuran dehydrogenase subunit E family protein [Methanomassiliicoccus luminyensis]|uniref:formylmethanofuran dehydrogenase subunit E family protein n=1 Tax=Methanomassiliicoccus luminyensis TaxID=1080712 RepID=UPI00036A1694|nr:formylmethanofuran dehydrogenase subunit E family protein [Methanomassiliicoccus luminyensis]
MVTLPKEMEELKRFHGHLGPYAVIGYRMGEIARKRFPQRIYAIVHSGTQRPLSCLADGVQMSSCCTLGKSNISVREDNEVRAEFSDGTSHLEISARPEVRPGIDGKCTHGNEEEMAMAFYDLPEADLFVITEGISAPFGR